MLQPFTGFLFHRIREGKLKPKKVCLAWATKKRHIAIDNIVLCEPKYKTSGYSVKNGQYNTISLSGLPDYIKDVDDKKSCHSDGIIAFKPLDKQSIIINTKSICNKCLKKYNNYF